MGAIGERDTHLALLRAVLREAEVCHGPGAIVPLSQFRWPDDLRERQLRKESH